MIVIGDISGIQSYVFDVAEEGGGQSQRLRARSFFIQLMAEAAMLRVLAALSWPLDDEHQLFAAAGKFALRGAPPADAVARLQAVETRLSQWLLRETGGELHVSLAWSDGQDSEIDQYRQANRRLQSSKLRAWSALAVQADGWNTSALQVDPLDTPCALCRRRRAETQEPVEDTGTTRDICRRCDADRQVGRGLPTAKWLIFREHATDTGYGILDYSFELSDVGVPAIGPQTIAIANLVNPDERPPNCPPERFLRRRLTRHVPADERGPIWFTELVRQSRGAQLLAVLKADVDSLGAAIHGLQSLAELVSFSRGLETFFADQLNCEIQTDPRWRRSIYTVFSGGDDLLLVGPWDILFDFAGHLQKVFQHQFGLMGLTLSAGLALIKPKFPIKHAVSQADDLLERAKQDPALGEQHPKDQLAAFGQIWKWQHHETIVSAGKQLVEWVGVAQRGWLHTLLQLTEARRGDRELGRPADLLATARLADRIARNCRPGTPMRSWADQLLADFDAMQTVHVRYLPTIIRYALAATRTSTVKD